MRPRMPRGDEWWFIGDMAALAGDVLLMVVILQALAGADVAVVLAPAAPPGLAGTFTALSLVAVVTLVYAVMVRRAFILSTMMARFELWLRRTGGGAS